MKSFSERFGVTLHPVSVCPPTNPAYKDRLRPSLGEREFFIYNILVRIHLIIVMIRWTGLDGSLNSLCAVECIQYTYILEAGIKIPMRRYLVYWQKTWSRSDCNAVGQQVTSLHTCDCNAVGWRVLWNCSKHYARQISPDLCPGT